MVLILSASAKYIWNPEPSYIALGEAELRILAVKGKFADLPSAGIWENRAESDEDLLEELGSGWQGFANAS